MKATNAAELGAEALAALRDPEVTAKVLTAIGEAYRDSRYLRAAGQMRGAIGGRKSADADDALRQIGDLLAAGTTRSVEAAARFVAAP